MQEKNTDEVIEAAGGLLWKKTDEGVTLAVIHRKKYHDWTFPKGKRESGESWQEAALREVYEETGTRGKIDSFAGGIIYQVYGVPKIVLFWNMIIIEEGEFFPNPEIDAFRWFSPKEATKVLSYENEKKLLNQNLSKNSSEQ